MRTTRYQDLEGFPVEVRSSLIWQIEDDGNGKAIVHILVNGTVSSVLTASDFEITVRRWKGLPE